MNTVTFGDLKVMYYTFRDTSKGSSRSKRHSTRCGIMTNCGDIQSDIWKSLAEQLIVREGEELLLEHLLEYEKEHPRIKKQSLPEYRQEALALHMCRIFDDPGWVSFIPFNRTYRPEGLEGINLYKATSLCCNSVGEYTTEQLKREEIVCSKCGRFTGFNEEK